MAITTKKDEKGNVTVGTSNAKHAYEIETRSITGRLTVHANNRNQARKFAEGAGFEVRSVNMVG